MSFIIGPDIAAVKILKNRTWPLVSYFHKISHTSGWGVVSQEDAFTTICVEVPVPGRAL